VEEVDGSATGSVNPFVYVFRSLHRDSSPTKGALQRAVCRGASATITYTFKARGSFEYLCSVPGHAAAGMKGLIKVI